MQTPTRRSAAEAAARAYFEAIHAGCTEAIAKAFAEDAEVHFPARDEQFAKRKAGPDK